MAAAIAGTFSGIQRVNAGWVDLITKVNGVDLHDLAGRLSTLNRTSTAQN
jgi:hypothetical protein